MYFKCILNNFNRICCYQQELPVQVDLGEQKNERCFKVRHSKYTDYGVRVLIYLYNKKDELATTREISEFYNISYNHLAKVVNDLSRAGFIMTQRGRSGGYRLCNNYEKLTLGRIVRELESDYYLVECFNKKENQCAITPYCKVKKQMALALEAYFTELDKVQIKDFAMPFKWGLFNEN